VSDLIEFTHKIAMSLHRVGLAGAAVDLKQFNKLGTEWTRDATQRGAWLQTYALRKGLKEFAPTNDSQIRELLYEKLHFPVVKETKQGLPSVDKATLKQLVKEHKKSPFIDNLIAFNSVDKLASTWYGKADGKKRRKSVRDLLVAIPKPHAKSIQDDIALLHFWIFPLRARTGRRASGGGEEGDPDSRNSQNWPGAARSVVVSRWKRSGLSICDFKSLEPVIVGWRAQDERFLDYFTNGEGYIGVARDFWGQKVVKDTPLYKATKSMVLGLDYNMKKNKLAHDLWYKADFKFSNDYKEHVKQTGAARHRYLRFFPGLARYIKDRIDEMSKTQRVISPSGRIRHFPHHGRDSEGFWHFENAAVNQPIQSFASEITGSAIVDYERAMLKEHGLSYVDWHTALLEHPWDLPCSPVINEVHDELDLDNHPETGDRDLEILVESMRNVKSIKKICPEFNLKLKVDVENVKRWKQ
jgi:DNA polymerase I-like protein with 3'-5' exonuclease and polymerase domains